MDIIITCNTKDFTMKGLEAIKPGVFVAKHLK